MRNLEPRRTPLRPSSEMIVFTRGLGFVSILLAPQRRSGHTYLKDVSRGSSSPFRYAYILSMIDYSWRGGYYRKYFKHSIIVRW